MTDDRTGRLLELAKRSKAMPRKTVKPPTAFMSKDMEILTSHYGHPHTVSVVQIKPDIWQVICLWATREKVLTVGSREEADIVAASVKSDFMP
jgi:hypothetical protein